jgi:uncharacterized membrane protein YgdD (TMEM256/DUF423 family)
MPPLSRVFFTLAGLSGLLAVLLGAFGAHLARGFSAPELRAVYETGNHYHFYHTLGLLAVALLSLHWPESVFFKWSGWLMVAGVVLFSGSLYALSLSGVRWWGAITPVGGTAFLAAWLLLIVGVLKVPQ